MHNTGWSAARLTPREARTSPRFSREEHAHAAMLGRSSFQRKKSQMNSSMGKARPLQSREEMGMSVPTGCPCPGSDMAAAREGKAVQTTCCSRQGPDSAPATPTVCFFLKKKQPQRAKARVRSAWGEDGHLRVMGPGKGPRSRAAPRPPATSPQRDGLRAQVPREGGEGPCEARGPSRSAAPGEARPLTAARAGRAHGGPGGGGGAAPLPRSFSFLPPSASQRGGRAAGAGGGGGGDGGAAAETPPAPGRWRYRGFAAASAWPPRGHLPRREGRRRAGGCWGTAGLFPQGEGGKVLLGWVFFFFK